LGVNQDNDIVDLYEAAYKNSPGDEELANHWFMALVRKGEYKSAQQVLEN
jgi:N-terminal acetyltransferase B complex non-catalytic subunit